MRKIRALIIDDEPLAHSVLKSYCAKLEFIEVIDCFFDCISTLNYLEENRVDVLLLDIQIPDMSGLELLDSLKENAPKVILTTAYSKFALRCFDYDQVVDYLHKPIRFSRFVKAMTRLKNVLSKEDYYQNHLEALAEDATPKYLRFKEKNNTQQVEFDQILYAQSWGNYIKLFLRNAEVKILRKTIKSLDEELASNDFLRIHKSYVINKKYVTELKGNQVKIVDANLPIGTSYVALVKRILINKF